MSFPFVTEDDMRKAMATSPWTGVSVFSAICFALSGMAKGIGLNCSDSDIQQMATRAMLTMAEVVAQHDAPEVNPGASLKGPPS